MRNPTGPAGRRLPWRVLLFALLGAVMVTVAVAVVRTHNRLVEGAEQVAASWAQVDIVLQRRADLIPQVAAVVEASANHERAVVETLSSVRRGYHTTEWPAQVEQARGMEGALQTAWVTIEAYPELASAVGWESLRRELVGSENRIAVERRRYNEAVRSQRARLRTFPGRLLAPLLGFTTPPEY